MRKNNKSEKSVVEVVGSGEEEPKAENRRLTKAGSTLGDTDSDLERFGIALREADLPRIAFDLEPLEFDK